MDQKQKGASNGGAGYRRMYNIRRANFAVLQHERRMIDESIQNRSKKRDRYPHPMGDIVPEIGAPPADTLLNRMENDIGFKQLSPQERGPKPHTRVWSKLNGLPDEPNPVRVGEVVAIRGGNKTTEKQPEPSKDNPKKQPKFSRTKATKPPQKIVPNSDSESGSLTTDFKRRTKRERLNERAVQQDAIQDSFQQGRDHTLHQGLITGIYYNMKSVGHIKYHEKMIGTGFRVGSHYLMTAWHVIRFIINPYMSQGISDYNWLRLKGKAVSLDFEEDRIAMFSLTGRYIYSNIKLDVAIVEIDRRGRRLPPPLRLSKQDASMVRDVYFIGYGHPTDVRKRVDPFCEVLDKNDSRIQAAKESILNKSDLRTIIRLQGLNPALMIRSYDDVDLTYRFAVQCTVEQGASGAPVISVIDGKAVGILVSGVPHFLNGFEKREYESLVKGLKHSRFELCTKLSSIYESLKSRRPYLAEEIFTPQVLLSRQAFNLFKPLSG